MIAVVDDGFARHDDQTDNVVDEYNAYSKNSDPYSGCTHGTHTAGTAAAVTDNEMGVPAVSTNV